MDLEIILFRALGHFIVLHTFGKYDVVKAVPTGHHLFVFRYTRLTAG